MKVIILFFTLTVFTHLMTSCAKCNNDNPTARVLNKGTGVADIQITAANGDIVSIADLASGSISSTKNYASGTTTISYTIENTEKVESFVLNTCTSYDISINSDNEMVLFSKEMK